MARKRNKESTLARFHREQLEKTQRFPSQWWTDEQVGAALNDLVSRQQNLAVCWPVGSSSVTQDDIDALLPLMDKADVICIPINTGAHWYPIVLSKKGNTSITTIPCFNAYRCIVDKLHKYILHIINQCITKF